MKLMKSIEYFYNAGQEIFLSIVVPLWVTVCFIVGIPGALVLNIWSFARVKSVGAYMILQSIKGKRGRLKANREEAAAEAATEEQPEEAPASATDAVPAT